MNRISRLAALGLLQVLLAAPARAAEDLAVSAGWDEQAFVGRKDRLDLKVNRPLLPEDGRLAVVLGSLDLSDLFQSVPGGLSYGPNAVPLPPGEHEVVVSRVTSAGEWNEVARFKLKVRSRAGFDSGTIAPVADLANKGQIAEGHRPDSAAPARATFQDLTAQLGWRTEHARGDFAIRTNINVTGVSFRQEALRFATLQDEAPKVDLAAYGVEVQKGWARLALGQVSFGTQRHLMNAFTSRGVVLTASPGRVVSLQVGAMNGSAPVGWDNFLGLSTAEHQMRSATLGLELVPSRPGGVRLELSALDGSVQPIAGFTQGAIQSAEKSQGGAARLLAADAAGRVRLEAGFSRARFQAAPDPQLEEGLTVRAIPDTTRNAQFADVTVTPFPSFAISPTTQGTFSVLLRHERVAPQYRSVAAFAQADRLQNGFDVNGTLGPLSLTGSFLWMEDNLDDVPSILKTKTNRAAGNLGVALPTLFGSPEKQATWLPVVSLNAEQTHQFGASIPVNADALETFIPDQVGTVAGAQLSWQAGIVQLGYRFGWSYQDNRQTGREAADLRNTTNGISAGFTPFGTLGLTVELSLERADNLETGRRDETRRLGGNLSWQAFSQTNVQVIASTTLGRDAARTSKNDSQELAAELSQGFKLGKLLPLSAEGVRGRAFLRYSSRLSSSFDATFGLQNSTAGWQWNTGVALSLF
ncbi:MAG TPA: hypothetical protein VE129_16095 [Thermoanaerobaculia bacterium]|nr:hypothetical protein [Thermoanaerobaculia bacterium]